MTISIDQRTAILEYPAIQPPGVFQIARTSPETRDIEGALELSPTLLKSLAIQHLQYPDRPISLTIKGQKSPGHPTFTGVVSAGAIG